MGLRLRVVVIRTLLPSILAIMLCAVPHAAADPGQPGVPGPIPLPLAVPQPGDAPRVQNIGGASAKSNVPQGMGNGTGQPLAAARERSNATVPPIAADGIHLPTAQATRTVVLHLPQERDLTAAAWGDAGTATYTSRDTDYRVVPFAGGGADVVITRRTIFTPEEFTFGLRVPEGTHVRQGVNTVLVETDAHPGQPATPIATVSVPVARDANGAPVQVTPVIHGDYVYQQSNIKLELGQANIFAFPIEITLSYRASSAPTNGALTSDWDGLPAGVAVPTVIPKPGDYVIDPGGTHRPANADPVLYAQRHADQCLSGPNEFRSEDGRTAELLGSCQRRAMCLDVSGQRTSVDACNNQAFSDMSAQCTAVFGQAGADYDACLNVANGHAAWSKENLLGGPLCQPVTLGTNLAFLPSNGNRYCKT
ncbi:hypothetical protein D2E65_09280 [Mycobacteroides abscessus]|nr:hypothetical protein [Mycobacteroides abscessus]RIR82148.1 hypothetical protein D2E65_09280 [Mycobacteroides abscessus]